MNKYPPCFPDDFEAKILPAGAREETRPVYRVIKYGTIDRQSFISTYEEIKQKLIPPRKNMDPMDPGLYSTSCNIEYSEAEYALKIFMRHKPKAFIAKGKTEKMCGPSQLTADREKRTDTHVDWWIYQESEPQIYFHEV